MRAGAWIAVLAASTVAAGLPAVAGETPLIQIAVEAVEVQTSRMRELGIRWSETLSAEEATIPGLFKVGRLDRLTQVRADLKAMMISGDAQLLANPKLITKSGSSASFLSGGQLPFVAKSGLHGPTVEWKDYGGILDIRPVVDGEWIDAEIRAGVSLIDWANAVVASDIKIPALTTRTVTSRVRVKAGETLTIAGLVETRKEHHVQGIPVLGELPVVGPLFSHQTWENRKTTLVMFLTPTLLK